MYAAAISLSAATTVGTVGIPHFHLGSIGPLQWFGIIVAAGVLIGASILRRYAEWHGVSDDHIRGLTGWITVTGFIGAHVLDVVMYQQHKPWFEINGIHPSEWPLMLKLWEGISSYGGFVGGALGFFFYVWWKRLPGKLMADIAIIGLLPAFSIGRIGCTVVSDHIGAYVDPSSSWAFLAENYPRNWNNDVIKDLVAAHPGTGEHILAWNLGLIELLYLIPVNAVILWLAFRRKRTPAGFITVLTGVLYAPVRFFLDYLRPESSDARHFGFTFAQWASLLAFGGAVYFAARVLKGGKAADTVAPTSKEAQEMLRVSLKDPGEPAKKEAPKPKAASPAKAAEAKPAEAKPAEAKPAESKAAEAKPAESKAAEAKPADAKDDPYAEAKRKKEEADEAAANERRRKQDEAMAAKEAAAKEAAENKAAADKKAPAEKAKSDDAKSDDAKSDDAKSDDAK